MAKIFLLLALVFVTQSSQALKCKKCKDIKCDELEDETCAVVFGTNQAACLTHIYQDINKNQITEKKCVSFEKGEKYKCENSQGTCNICMEDFCNLNNAGLGIFRVSLMLNLFLSVFFIYTIR